MKYTIKIKKYDLVSASAKASSHKIEVHSISFLEVHVQRDFFQRRHATRSELVFSA